MIEIPHPTEWDLTAPPTSGQLAEAGVSWAVDRGEHTGWLHSATLVHAPSGSRATMAHEQRDRAVHATWVALHDLLIENDWTPRGLTR